jgi:L-ascorbate metabolism protein UlaG (beta-lactamase superfamily)
LLATPAAFAQTTIQYLANEGVMIAGNSAKVLFDPLYDNSYGRYQMVPDEIRDGIFAGRAPYDDVDAVFVSHHHGDHFAAADVLRLLREQQGIRLYAPAQAVAAIREIAGEGDTAALDRVTGLDLEYGDEPVSMQVGALVIDAIHVPHSGWPTARTDIQNIAFRVTLEGEATVLHLGDADARVVHFEQNEAYWEERQIDLALPPYWFLGSDDGIEILENRLNVIHSIGIHVPEEYANPANLPAELRTAELFTRPGEGRRF